MCAGLGLAGCASDASNPARVAKNPGELYPLHAELAREQVALAIATSLLGAGLARRISTKRVYLLGLACSTNRPPTRLYVVGRLRSTTYRSRRSFSR